MPGKVLGCSMLILLPGLHWAAVIQRDAAGSEGGFVSRRVEIVLTVCTSGKGVPFRTRSRNTGIVAFS